MVVSKANRANTDLSIAKPILLKAISQYTLTWGHDSWFGNDLEAERINNLLLVEQLIQELVYIFLLKEFWSLL